MNEPGAREAMKEWKVAARGRYRCKGMGFGSEVSLFVKGKKKKKKKGYLTVMVVERCKR
jgi:hypothetical protein